MKRLPAAALLALSGAVSALGGCAPHKWHLFDGPRYRYAYDEETTREDRQRKKRVETASASDVEYCRGEYANAVSEGTPFKDLVWDTPIRGEVLTRLTLQRDGVFAETKSNKVYRLDVNTGLVTWVFDVGTPLDFPPSPTSGVDTSMMLLQLREANAQTNLKIEQGKAAKDQQKINGLMNELAETRRQMRALAENDFVYLVSRSMLYCLDSSGNLLWKKLLAFSPGTQIYATGSTVYLGAMNAKRAFALDAVTGGVSGWFDTGGIVTARPIYEDPALILASQDGGIYAYGSTGNISWLYRTERPIVADMALYEDMVYVGSTDYALYAMSRITGSLKWKYESGGPILTRPWATKNTVMVKSDGIGFLGIDAATGKLKWKLPQGERFLVKGIDRVYIESGDHCIYGVNEKTGEIVERFDPGVITLLAPNPTGDLFIGATKDGYVFAARPSRFKF
ncbi:MAG: PQQ-binding-like beta-propeller repeat protein [Planctomycetes bacterium]|nr:PQQ-binding-like beta-propeller repeat protein [Planctomycetota bacterium]